MAIRSSQLARITKVLKDYPEVDTFEIAFLKDKILVDKEGNLVLDENADIIVTSKDLIDYHLLKRVKSKGNLFMYSKDGHGYSQKMTAKACLKRAYKHLKDMKDPIPDDVLLLWDDGKEEPTE